MVDGAVVLVVVVDGGVVLVVVVDGGVVLVVVVVVGAVGGGTKVNMPWTQSAGDWATTTSTPGIPEYVHTLSGGPFCRQARAGEVVATVVTVPTNCGVPGEAGGTTGVSGTVT